jgi:hypothetical protein
MSQVFETQSPARLKGSKHCYRNQPDDFHHAPAGVADCLRIAIVYVVEITA